MKDISVVQRRDGSWVVEYNNDSISPGFYRSGEGEHLFEALYDLAGRLEEMHGSLAKGEDES